MNLTRQPLLIAFPTFLLLLGGVLVRKLAVSFAPEAVVGLQSLFAGWITLFQTTFPRAAWGLWMLCHLFVAITLGRMGLRHNLYGGNTLLAVPLYGILACGIYLGDDLLTSALAALLLARAMRYFCSSCRNGYAFQHLFYGALCLGTLPLIYPSALPLLLLLPLVTILFKRTLREWIVALTGVVLPFGALLYLHWAVTGELFVPLQNLLAILNDPCNLHLFEEASPLLILQLVVMLAATLCALFYYLSDIYASTSKVRAILTAHLWLFLLAAATLLMPGATIGMLVLPAIPMAMLLPFLFIRLKRPLANSLYLLMLLLAVARMLIR